MNLSYRIAWYFFHTVFAIYFRWKVYNPERLPKEGGVILASNHASILDPPMISTGVSRMVINFGRRSLFTIPVVGAVLRSWKAVPVDRDGGGGAGLKAILDRLLDGGVILVFPEGTRTFDGKLRPAKSGIGLMVIKSTAPVVPARVFGTFEAYGRQMKFPRPHHVAVKYGCPLDFAALREEAKTCDKPRLKEIYQQVADEVMAAIAKLEPRKDD
jgi:1-acyl-sn-glycerol-3-phosphate acyltransferase